MQKRDDFCSGSWLSLGLTGQRTEVPEISHSAQDAGTCFGLRSWPKYLEVLGIESRNRG